MVKPQSIFRLWFMRYVKRIRPLTEFRRLILVVLVLKAQKKVQLIDEKREIGSNRVSKLCSSASAAISLIQYIGSDKPS